MRELTHDYSPRDCQCHQNIYVVYISLTPSLTGVSQSKNMLTDTLKLPVSQSKNMLTDTLKLPVSQSKNMLTDRGVSVSFTFFDTMLSDHYSVFNVKIRMFFNSIFYCVFT